MKNLLHTILLPACIALSLFPAKGQFTYNYLRAGDDYFKKGDYYSAAQYYEKYLKSITSGEAGKFDPYTVAGRSKDKHSKKDNEVSREEVVYKTGESYQLLKYYVKAEPYFKEALSYNAKFPLARYWYAKSLRANAKFQEAETELNTFLQEYSTKDSYRDDAVKELQNLTFIQKELKKNDIALYTVNKAVINAAGSASAPAVISNRLVFSSTRPDSSAGKNPYINRLYESSLNNPDEVTKLNLPQAKDEHLEGASFTADGNTMYVTKWSLKGNNKSAGVYKSTLENNTWTQPVQLGADINSAGYNSQQPFVTPDGRYLYYSSDKPGGFGKFDLYVAPLNAEGNPGASVNLGSGINTSEDEYAPYFYTPSGTLVFSSNGRVGMGGFDFYEARGSLNVWEQPVNLGYPVNSVKDDIYIAGTGNKYFLDHIFFSSDRGSDCCLELFSATKRRVSKRISGVVTDCATGSPLPGAVINMVDAGNNAAGNRITNERGGYELVLDEYAPIAITAGFEGYTVKTVHVNKPATAEDTIVNASFCLVKPESKPFEENKAVVINNVYYDFNKATLQPGSFIVLDSVIAILQKYPGMVIEIGGHTDSKGSEQLNIELSEARAKAFVDYLISKGIDASRLESKGYGASKPIAPNKLPNGKDNPAGREKNRRTEIKVLHY